MTLQKTLSMKKNIPFIFLFWALLSFTRANAQTEITHLFVKGYVPASSGAFLDIGIPVTCDNMLMIEPSLEYFVKGDDYAFVWPMLAGIRHMFNHTDHGLYAEPLAGYMFGSTTIPKTASSGAPLTDANGNPIQQKGNGVTAGFGLGYSFPHSGEYTVEFRYEHTFLEGHPQLDILSFRAAYTIKIPRHHR
jgi:hypothetical protein